MVKLNKNKDSKMIPNNKIPYRSITPTKLGKEPFKSPTKKHKPYSDQKENRIGSQEPAIIKNSSIQNSQNLNLFHELSNNSPLLPILPKEKKPTHTINIKYDATPKQRLYTTDLIMTEKNNPNPFHSNDSTLTKKNDYLAKSPREFSTPILDEKECRFKYVRKNTSNKINKLCSTQIGPKSNIETYLKELTINNSLHTSPSVASISKAFFEKLPKKKVVSNISVIKYKGNSNHYIFIGQNKKGQSSTNLELAFLHPYLNLINELTQINNVVIPNTKTEFLIPTLNENQHIKTEPVITDKLSKHQFGKLIGYIEKNNLGNLKKDGDLFKNIVELMDLKTSSIKNNLYDFLTLRLNNVVNEQNFKNVLNHLGVHNFNENHIHAEIISEAIGITYGLENNMYIEDILNINTQMGHCDHTNQYLTNIIKDTFKSLCSILNHEERSFFNEFNVTAVIDKFKLLENGSYEDKQRFISSFIDICIQSHKDVMGDDEFFNQYKTNSNSPIYFFFLNILHGSSNDSGRAAKEMQKYKKLCEAYLTLLLDELNANLEEVNDKEYTLTKKTNFSLTSNDNIEINSSKLNKESIEHLKNKECNEHIQFILELYKLLISKINGCNERTFGNFLTEGLNQKKFYSFRNLPIETHYDDINLKEMGPTTPTHSNKKRYHTAIVDSDEKQKPHQSPATNDVNVNRKINF
ncbi:MAG: hypothetical protein ACO3K7_04600 [Candidatus Marinamargulisbacteria bacterium]